MSEISPICHSHRFVPQAVRQAMRISWSGSCLAYRPSTWSKVSKNPHSPWTKRRMSEAVGKPLIERFRSILNQRISLRARVFSNSLSAISVWPSVSNTGWLTGSLAGSP